ncbi:bifunctional DedA family/phosphatase PAP2 family protein [Pseudomonas matsuisoli]|uniref:Phosphatidic acid phosphatase type 2/haloperoxidase domain-containing protein n=1 Tax=Pseudomonas matsuisoli TaxID=1515666 RepID=A0A917PWV6_9PSED|nr:bifunctional DedA family/phosphatase PAP2 family protein [Pseudomonas matsuisoli]GGJ97258.1 hypothetical protein GCM10009304_23920 [Pseudomonas matsuisoli]
MPFDLQSINTWLSSHPEWLGVTLFLAAFVECLAIAGLIVPGTVLLFAVGVLAGNGVLGLGETLLLAFAGGLAGDIVSYLLGRRFHQNIRGLPVLRQHPEWFDHAERHIEQYGVISLLVGRFIGPLRPMLPMIAGMLDMPFIRFLLVSLIASAGWAVAYLLPGWSTGAALRLPLPAGFWTEAGIVVGLLAAFLGILIQRALTDKPYNVELGAGLCFVLFAALFFALPHLEALDNGLISVIQDARQPTWDRVVAFTTGLGDFDAQLLAAIALCASLAALRQWRAAGFALGALLGTAVANGQLKNLFARVRPEVLVDPLHTFSFPSGHSSAAFALCLTLGILAGRDQPARWRLTWLLLACLPAVAIAASRIYLGVHWPTDIIAGALLAGFFCALSLCISERFAPINPLPARNWYLVLFGCAFVLIGFAIWVFPNSLALYRYQ